MKNGWLFWVFIIGVVVTVFISFNYEGSKTVVPLSEIFPEDQELAQVEYEFVESEVVPSPAKEIKQTKQAEVKVSESQKVVTSKIAPQKTAPIQKAVVSTSESAVETAKKQDTKLTFTTTKVKSSPLDSIKDAIKEAPENLAKAVETVSSNEVAPASAGDFTIQVASFKNQESATVELQRLLKKDFPAFVESRDLADKGTWYRVYIGRFETKQKAGEYLKDVQASYKDSFIIKLK